MRYCLASSMSRLSVTSLPDILTAVNLFHSDGTFKLDHLSGHGAGNRVRITVFGPRGGSWGRFFMSDAEAAKLVSALLDETLIISLDTPLDSLMGISMGGEYHVMVKPLTGEGQPRWGFSLHREQLEALRDALPRVSHASALAAAI